MLSSRGRVQLALNHKEPDRVPLDLGGTVTTGMHVSSVYALRQALALDEPGTPVKVVDAYQMLGETKPDLVEALGVDVVALNSRGSYPTHTIYGFLNMGWKQWTLFDGTPVLVPERFNTETAPAGDILQYPEGDKAAEPCARMPVGGWYFDAMIRQTPIHDDELKAEDNLEELNLLSDQELELLAQQVAKLYSETDKAIVGRIPGTDFGNVGLVPGMGLKNPKGIRDIEEWYVSHITRQDYIYQMFERQSEIALANLERFYRAVSDRIDVLFITGADFGAQKGPLISPELYRRLYKPFHKRVNDWVHEHTNWRTFIHSCGAVRKHIRDFIEAGFDVLNPVQTSAAGMDPMELKNTFGSQIVFWGAGIETQTTLPNGTPDEVRIEVLERLEIFKPGGGYIFGPIHNIQPKVPPENILAMYRAAGRAQ